jgi:FtsH-binding integral membrane protein
MSTLTGQSVIAGRPAGTLPGRRFDHVFFSFAALLMLATVFLGFARTYYLAGVFHAPLPSLIIHVHGALFSSWIVILIAQTSLVSAGRVDIHRRLGLAGFFVAAVMVIVGVLAATDSLVRADIAGRDARFFYIVPLTDMVIFGVLIFFAYRKRSDSAAHKRLIYLATSACLIAATARWPFFAQRNLLRATLLDECFVLILVAYDLWATHKVHRATLWGGAFLVLVQQLRIPIGHMHPWIAFATWIQSLLRH